MRIFWEMQPAAGQARGLVGGVWANAIIRGLLYFWLAGIIVFRFSDQPNKKTGFTSRRAQAIKPTRRICPLLITKIGRAAGESIR